MEGMRNFAAAILKPYQAGKAPSSTWRGQSPVPATRSALALGLQLYKSWRRPVLACPHQVSNSQQDNVLL